jgi:predicted PurR-regulated permease PerM
VGDLRSGRFHNTLLKLREHVPADYQDEFTRAIAWLSPSAADVRGADAATQPDSQPNQPFGEAEIRQLVRQELAAHQDGSTPWWAIARRGGEAVFGWLGAIIALGLLAFLIPFYFFFFSVSFPTILTFFRSLIPERNRARAIELTSKMDRAVAGFVRGRIVICLLMGIMLAIGWMLCGVPYAIVLGILVGAFSLVPYLGGIGVPLAVGLLGLEQLGLPPEQRMGIVHVILWPTVVFGIVQVIETYILTPTIAGKATNLDPVTILVAVLAGGVVGGVYGMILAIPVTACLKIIVTEVLLPKIRAWARGEAMDPLPLGRE